MYTFFIGVDLGQAQDYTAIAVLRRREVIEPSHVSLSEYDTQLHEDLMAASIYELVHLERLALGTTYPDIVAHIKRLLSSAELSEERVLVVDATGVGKPVVDMLKAENVGPLVSLVITGGLNVSQSSDYNFHVPKKDIVSCLQLYVQNGRLKFAAGLPDIELLVQEITHFKVKVAITAGEDAASWREHPHDDTAFAVGIALWYAARFGMQRPIFEEQSGPDEHYDVLRYGL